MSVVRAVSVSAVFPLPPAVLFMFAVFPAERTRRDVVAFSSVRLLHNNGPLLRRTSTAVRPNSGINLIKGGNYNGSALFTLVGKRLDISTNSGHIPRG